jgi:hypothetical protein
MEDKYPIKEIKVMEGVYIWKPEKAQDNNNSPSSSNNDKTNNKNINDYNIKLNANKSSIGQNEYLCHGKDELIKIYEIEFEELGNRVQALFQSNEDMLEFDPHDYDLIQAREENLELIDKKIDEMIKIQQKMKEVCDYHPMVNVDIFEYFGIGTKNSNKDENKINIDKKEGELIEVKEEFIKIENKINNNINENKDQNNEINTNENTQKNKTESGNDIVSEIEL